MVQILLSGNYLLIHVIDFKNAWQRMKELQVDEDKEKMLRLIIEEIIEADGCSGFQYNFTLDDKTNSDDRYHHVRVFSGFVSSHRMGLNILLTVKICLLQNLLNLQ